jgi:hypothetical protein
MRKLLLALVLGVLSITLLVGGTALAATWEDIHNDLAADGRLDGDYTADELKDYLNNATVREYDSVIQSRLDSLTKTDGDRSVFPFTGFQLTIAGIVAVVLIGGGIALRRFSRPQRPQ